VTWDRSDVLSRYSCFLHQQNRHDITEILLKVVLTTHTCSCLNWLNLRITNILIFFSISKQTPVKVEVLLLYTCTRQCNIIVIRFLIFYFKSYLFLVSVNCQWGGTFYTCMYKNVYNHCAQNLNFNEIWGSNTNLDQIIYFHISPDIVQPYDLNQLSTRGWYFIQKRERNHKNLIK